jgi:hypothetical protein
MKIRFLQFLLLVITISNCYSQNVGIGTSSPTERLDVNGNINLSGDIKINNRSGSPQQILMRGSNNALTWGNPFQQYSRNIVIVDTGVGVFTVPTGITKVMVEIWGAGGAGSGVGSAGGGGGYATATLNVVAGQSINYYVGKGGKGYPVLVGSSLSYYGLDGEHSYFIVDSEAIIATGGSGASDGAINASSGTGGTFILNTNISNNIMNSWGMNGESGSGIWVHYGGINGLVEYFHFGNGGDAGNFQNTGGVGEISGYDAGQKRISPARQPGGGGPSFRISNYNVPIPDLIKGGDGMIVFWW